MHYASHFKLRRPGGAARLLSIAVVGVLLIAGCGNGDDDNGNGNGEVPTQPPAESPTATPDPGSQNGVPGEGQDAAQSIRDVIDAYNAGDVEAFLAHWTEAGLQSEFGATADQIRANPAVFFASPVGGIQIGEFRDVQEGDESASVEFEFIFGRMLTLQRYDLVNQDGRWQIDATAEVDIDVPDGVQAVSVDLEEFAFAFDAGEVGDGNVAFQVENIGEQSHELVMLQVPEGLTVEELLALEGNELPEGIEIVGSIGPFLPGEGGNMVFSQPLAAGSYMFLCFLPNEGDPQGAPHLLEGMTATFQVPAP